MTPSAKLVVKTGDSIKFIPLAKIDWLEAQENYVRVHSHVGEYMVRTTMKHLEANLCNTSLVRCHRSAIVNVDNIAQMRFSRQRRELTTTSGDTLAVSATGQKKLLEKTG